MPKKIDYTTKLDSAGELLLHNDANLVGFFEQKLEQVLAKTYDIKYPQLKGAIAVPVDTSINSGADSFAFETYDMVGMAKIISDYSQDLPQVGITGEKTVRSIRSLGVSFGYSIQEIRAAQMAGMPLQQRKANAARAFNEQGVNRIAWNGDTEYGLYGLLNYPNVPISDVPNDGTGSTTEWINKTPAQILRDMEDAITEVLDTTKGVHAPNTLLIPLKQWSTIKRKAYSDLSPDSILKVFEANNPEITVDWVNELKGAGTTGEDVMIAYEKNIDNLALQIPQGFETFPPQAKALAINIPTHSRIGGVVVYYPLSVNIKEGI